MTQPSNMATRTLIMKNYSLFAYEPSFSSKGYTGQSRFDDVNCNCAMDACWLHSSHLWTCRTLTNTTKRQKLKRLIDIKPRPKIHSTTSCTYKTQAISPQICVCSMTSLSAWSHRASARARAMSSHNVEWCFILL